MNEITSNIYQLELPLPNNPLGYVNAYLARGDKGCLLADTGWDTNESLEALRRQLGEVGLRIEDISQVVGSHTHPDHYGLAGRIRALSEARIALHYLEREQVIPSYSDISNLIQQAVEWMHLNGVPTEVLTQGLSQLRQARPELMKFSAPVQPDITLHGGEVFSTGNFNFRVLWAPGHSPGHICLYEPQKGILVSGDHILPDVVTDASLEPNSSPNPLGDYINSLNEIKQLSVILTLPGHGQPFTGLKHRIDEIIQSQRQRSSEIMDKISAEAKTAYDVSTEITWMIRGSRVSVDDLSPWDKRLALLKTLAHLEAMRFDGKVEKLNEGGVIRYQSKNN